MHSLRALQHCAFALDVYLWDACNGALEPHPAPAPGGALPRVGREPSLRPTPRQIREFEHELGVAREKIARLSREVDSLSDDPPFSV